MEKIQNEEASLIIAAQCYHVLNEFFLRYKQMSIVLFVYHSDGQICESNKK